jgi:hypothetical protein
LGKTLVNAVSVGVVGNDENAAVGPCGGCKESQACQNCGKNPNCGENMHDVPEKSKVVTVATANAGDFAAK